MTSDWSLRQLFAKKNDRSPDTEVAEQSASLTGMIESGDFKFDLVRRAVTLSGENLLLTSEEFDVLVFLASHPQRLVTPPHCVGDKLDGEWTSADRVLESLDVLTQKARCCRTR